MGTNQPRYSTEEFARRGEAIFERDILPKLKAARKSDYVLIDIETGAYEIDRDEQAATDRLLARVPDAQIWFSASAPAMRTVSVHGRSRDPMLTGKVNGDLEVVLRLTGARRAWASSEGESHRRYRL